MKILDIQRDLEESLTGLSTSTLPPTLEGLRHLPVNDRNPQVSIRNLDKGRKVREDADASYFDPDRCEVVIRFVAVEDAHEEQDWRESSTLGPDGKADVFDFETATGQLLDALKEVESKRSFVGLKWFRDQFLPACGHAWAGDPRTSGALLRHATEQRLILTSRAPNPYQPHHPVTAIRINRRHPRFQSAASEDRAGFTPVRIRGGAISDTVLGDRR